MLSPVSSPESLDAIPPAKVIRNPALTHHQWAPGPNGLSQCQALLHSNSNEDIFLIFFEEFRLMQRSFYQIEWLLSIDFWNLPLKKVEFINCGNAFFFARHPSCEVSECVTASPTGFSPQPVISTRFCHRSPRSWPCFQSWVTFHQFHLFHPTQTRVSQEIPKTHTHRIHVRYGFITHIWLIFCNKCVIA